MMNWQTTIGEKRGYMAVPPAGHGSGVLVLHAWWGLTDTFTDLCDQLAAAGFVAFAPDMFDGLTAQTIEQAEQLIETEDSGAIQAIVESALDYLSEHSAVRGNKIGIIGFSFGAAWALLAATAFRPANIGATVLFYGNHSGLERDDYVRAEAAFQGHFAEHDPYEDAVEVRHTLAEIQKAGRKADFHFYPGTGHWFFESNRPDAYQPEAAQLAWERTLTFLREQL
jgi:carboxymethylenebutenolidase